MAQIAQNPSQKAKLESAISRLKNFWAILHTEVKEISSKHNNSYNEKWISQIIAFVQQTQNSMNDHFHMMNENVHLSVESFKLVDSVKKFNILLPRKVSDMERANTEVEHQAMIKNIKEFYRQRQAVNSTFHSFFEIYNSHLLEFAEFSVTTIEMLMQELTLRLQHKSSLLTQIVKRNKSKEKALKDAKKQLKIDTDRSIQDNNTILISIELKAISDTLAVVSDDLRKILETGHRFMGISACNLLSRLYPNVDSTRLFESLSLNKTTDIYEKVDTCKNLNEDNAFFNKPDNSDLVYNLQVENITADTFYCPGSKKIKEMYRMLGISSEQISESIEKILKCLAENILNEFKLNDKKKFFDNELPNMLETIKPLFSNRWNLKRTQSVLFQLSLLKQNSKKENFDDPATKGEKNTATAAALCAVKKFIKECTENEIITNIDKSGKIANSTIGTSLSLDSVFPFLIKYLKGLDKTLLEDEIKNPALLNELATCVDGKDVIDAIKRHLMMSTKESLKTCAMVLKKVDEKYYSSALSSLTKLIAPKDYQEEAKSMLVALYSQRE